jgi:hypothetical protein
MKKRLTAKQRRERDTREALRDPGKYINSFGPSCDPFHLTAANKRWHRAHMDINLASGNLDMILKILAAYPYLRDEYGEQVARLSERRHNEQIEIEDDYPLVGY